MMLTKCITQTLFSRLQIFPPMCTQIAGLKNFLPPKQPKQIEYPERRKLRIMERTPQYPPGMKAPKMQKRLKYMRGPEAEHNTILLHKQFAIVATRGGRLRQGHFEMIRLTLGRKMDVNRMFAVWRVDPPWQPVTKKGQGHRMGGGKGSIDHYVTPIKAGRVIIEVAGDCEFFEVKRVLTEIADKLPFEAMAVSQGMLDKQKERDQWLEENNINPWTWKYMIQNNMGGCHQWISPVDKFWFNKYL